MRWTIVTVALLLTSCVQSPPTYERKETYKLPPELADCKLFKLKHPDEQSITVMYCPGRQVTNTSYSETQGKTTVQRNVIVVNGVEYQEIQK